MNRSTEPVFTPDDVIEAVVKVIHKCKTMQTHPYEGTPLDHSSLLYGATTLCEMLTTNGRLSQRGVEDFVMDLVNRMDCVGQRHPT